ncbi:unnamed protein product, partial [Didymodactylos carnosus]
LNDPVTDWMKDELTIEQNGDNVIIKAEKKPEPTPNKLSDVQCMVISAKTLKRGIRKRHYDPCYAVFLCDENEDKNTKNIEWMNKLLQDYNDVFRNELPGLPPDRSISHITDTGVASSIKKQCYRMSPAELEELRKQ